MQRDPSAPARTLAGVSLCLALAATAGSGGACGSSDPGGIDSGSGGYPDAAAPPLDAALDGGAATPDGSPPGPRPLLVYVYDQGLDAIVLLRDGNGDGDANDVGERWRFFDDSLPGTGVGNSQGLWVAPDGTLLASDNKSSVTPRDDNVVALRDANGDRDALDPGEATVFFDGALPSGDHIGNPTCLSAGPSGDLLLVDNNFLEASPPTAVYRLHDADGSGSIAAAEVTREDAADPISVDNGRVLFDVAEDTRGALWLFDVTDAEDDDPPGARLYRIAPDGSRALALTAPALLSATGILLTSTWGKIAPLPGDEEFVVEAGIPLDAYTLDPVLIAFGDGDDDGAIAPASEVRVLWRRSSHPEIEGGGFGSRDITLAPDGSLLVVWGGRAEIHRFTDLDGDGDMDDPGETTVFFSQAAAEGDVVPSGTYPVAAGLDLP